MTTLQLKVKLPDQLAEDARREGLLTPQAVAKLLRDAMRKRAAQSLLRGAARATRAGSRRMSLDEIQERVDAVRQRRRPRSGKA
jgi:hypothetical protein